MTLCNRIYFLTNIIGNTMTWINRLLPIAAAVVVFFVISVDGLSCIQCNIYGQGRHINCDDTQMDLMNRTTDCLSCQKTHTRMYKNDRLGKISQSVVDSRYCIKRKLQVKPEGCYYSMGNSAITKSCYCNTDFCNGANGNHQTIFFAMATSLFFILRNAIL